MHEIKLSKEKEEQKSSIFDALGTIKKFHPVAFILLFMLIYVSATVYNLDIALEKKILSLALSGSLYIIGVFFEFHRIDKKQELEQKVMQGSFSQ